MAKISGNVSAYTTLGAMHKHRLINSRSGACVKVALFVALFAIQHAALAQPDDAKIRDQLRQHEEVLRTLRTAGRFEEIDRGDVIQFVDASKGQVFLVTKAGHAVHPGYVIQQVIEQNGQLFVKIDGNTFGDKEALKKWIDYLQESANRDIAARRRR